MALIIWMSIIPLLGADPVEAFDPDQSDSNQFDPNQEYTIVSVHSGKALEVKGSSKENAGNIQQADYKDTNNQLWTLEPLNNGYYKIISRDSGKVVDQSTPDIGANVHQYEYVGGVNQQWKIEKAGDSYKIISRQNGKVLDVANGNKDNGGNVQAWDDNGTSAQRWKIETRFDPNRSYALFNLNSNKALEVASIGKENGGNIQQWDYKGKKNQLWYLIPVESGYYKIVSKNSGKVLDVANWSKENVGNIIQHDYHEVNNQNQLWKIEMVNNNKYKIVSKNSDKVINVEDWSEEDGANINQYDYKGSSSQLWKIKSEFDPSQTYAILSVHSNKALDVEGWSKENSTNISQYTYYGRSNQRWNLIPVEGDYYKIINKNSGKAISVAGWSKEDGANILQYDYYGGDNQLWKIERSDGDSYRIYNQYSGKILNVAGWNRENGGNIIQYPRTSSDNELWRIEADSSGEKVGFWHATTPSGKQNVASDNHVDKGYTLDFQFGNLLKEQPAVGSSYFYYDGDKNKKHGYYFNDKQEGTVPLYKIKNKKNNDDYWKIGDYLKPEEEKDFLQGYIYPKTPFNAMETQNNQKMVSIKHKDENVITIIEIRDDNQVWLNRGDAKGWSEKKLNQKAVRIVAIEIGGKVLVFALGTTDNQLWLLHIDKDGTPDNEWQKMLPGKRIDRLVLHVDGQAITVRDVYGHLFTQSLFNLASYWKRLDLGAEIGEPQEIYDAGKGSGLIIIGEDQSLWYYEQKGDNVLADHFFKGWVDRAAVIANEGNVDIVARNGEQSLFHFRKVHNQSGWKSEILRDQKVDRFDVGYDVGGKLEVFARGEDFHLYQISEKDSGWSQWYEINNYVDNLTVMNEGPGKLGVIPFIYNMNHELFDMREVPDAQKGCSDWTIPIPAEEEGYVAESRAGAPLADDNKLDLRQVNSCLKTIHATSSAYRVIKDHVADTNSNPKHINNPNHNNFAGLIDCMNIARTLVKHNLYFKPKDQNNPQDAYVFYNPTEGVALILDYLKKAVITAYRVTGVGATWQPKGSEDFTDPGQGLR